MSGKPGGLPWGSPWRAPPSWPWKAVANVEAVANVTKTKIKMAALESVRARQRLPGAWTARRVADPHPTSDRLGQADRPARVAKGCGDQRSEHRSYAATLSDLVREWSKFAPCKNGPLARRPPREFPISALSRHGSKIHAGRPRLPNPSE